MMLSLTKPFSIVNDMRCTIVLALLCHSQLLSNVGGKRAHGMYVSLLCVPCAAKQARHAAPG